jgi:hypothetical protein
MHDYQEFRIGCAQLKVITHSGLELQVPLDGSARRLTRASCEHKKKDLMPRTTESRMLFKSYDVYRKAGALRDAFKQN